MTEKIGMIKNPLTIIAIFAGIAEVSGTLVLPFIKEPNQMLFIYFLVSFPSILVILFFLTLNFNHKVLYAPSDYINEDNFFRISKYDSSKQEEVQIKISKNDEGKILNEQITKLQEEFGTKFQQIETKLATTGTSSASKTFYSYLISKIPKSKEFVSLMKKHDYNFEIYGGIKNEDTENEDAKNFDAQKSIWLGKNIPLEIAKDVLLNAKKFYPHLEYINIPSTDKTPTHVHNQIFIGGSTESAKNLFKLNRLEKDDFITISKFNSLEDLHSFIKSFRIQ